MTFFDILLAQPAKSQKKAENSEERSSSEFIGLAAHFFEDFVGVAYKIPKKMGGKVSVRRRSEGRPT